MERLRRLVLIASAALVAAGADASASTERNNWVVLVETSRYWYNYRHSANVLSFYHTVKRLGIPDSHIIMMMAEDMPCNSRNNKPGTVFNERRHNLNLYGEEVEVDYRGDEVSVENFLRLLTGRHPPSTPRNKRLLTDSSSNIFIFATGHSGEEFIKFQDWEELTSTDLADAFQQMWQQKRYKQIFWMSDTCQAATLQNQFYSPGILAYGSSGKKENSYSHHLDADVGVAVIDRFTFYSLENLNRLTPTSPETVQGLTRWFDPKLLKATPEMRTDLFGRNPGDTLLTEFLASTGRPRFQLRLLELARDSKGHDVLEGLLRRNRSQDSLPSREFRPPQQDDSKDLWQLVEDLADAATALFNQLRQVAPGNQILAVQRSFSSSGDEAGGFVGAGTWLLAFLGMSCVSTLVL